VKEGDLVTNRILSVTLENHGDVYAADCTR
jgi:hypothetical protein